MQTIMKEKLNLVKVDEEKIQNIKKSKEDRDKEIKENEMKLKEEEKNKKLAEEEIQKEEQNIIEAEQKLKEKDSLIENKRQEIANLTNVLEDVFKNDQKKLEKEKETIAKELNSFKQDAIKQFLTIKKTRAILLYKKGK